AQAKEYDQANILAGQKNLQSVRERYQKAEKSYREALQIQRFDHRYWQARGLVLEDLGKLEVESFRHNEQTTYGTCNPSDKDCQQNLPSKHLIKASYFRQAYDCYAEAFSFRPDDIDLQGRVQKLKNEYIQALVSFDETEFKEEGSENLKKTLDKTLNKLDKQNGKTALHFYKVEQACKQLLGTLTPFHSKNKEIEKDSLTYNECKQPCSPQTLNSSHVKQNKPLEEIPVINELERNCNQLLEALTRCYSRIEKANQNNQERDDTAESGSGPGYGALIKKGDDIRLKNVSENKAPDRNIKILKRAFNFYEEAIWKSPEYPLGWYSRGLAYAKRAEYQNDNEKKQKDYRQAIQDYEKALSLKEDLAWAYYDQGLAYHGIAQVQAETSADEARQEFELALEKFDYAIRLDSDYEDAWYKRGLTLVELNRFEEAIASYDKAIECAQASNHSQKIVLNAQDNVDTDNIYRQRVPLEAIYWYDRGEAYAKHEDFEEAVASYKKAIELGKSCYYQAKYRLGIVLRDGIHDDLKAADELGIYGGAIEDLQEEIKRTPNNSFKIDGMIHTLVDSYYFNLVQIQRDEDKVKSWKDARDFLEEEWENRSSDIGCSSKFHCQLIQVCDSLLDCIPSENLDQFQDEVVENFRIKTQALKTQWEAEPSKIEDGNKLKYKEAKAYLEWGHIMYNQYDNSEEAKEQLDKAKESLEKLIKAETPENGSHREWHCTLADVYHELGNLEASKNSYYENAFKTYEEILINNPPHGEALKKLMQDLYNLVSEQGFSKHDNVIKLLREESLQKLDDSSDAAYNSRFILLYCCCKAKDEKYYGVAKSAYESLQKHHADWLGNDLRYQNIKSELSSWENDIFEKKWWIETVFLEKYFQS
ncbi:MAG: tetratricopeptide repeat protein, partial [Cyanobacteria bacterium P01_F01_bin.53]